MSGGGPHISPSPSPGHGGSAGRSAAAAAEAASQAASSTLPWVSNLALSDPLIRAYEERLKEADARIAALEAERANLAPRVEAVVRENEGLRREVEELASVTLQHVEQGAVPITVGTLCGVAPPLNGAALTAAAAGAGTMQFAHVQQVSDLQKQIGALEKENDAFKDLISSLDAEEDEKKANMARLETTLAEYRESSDILKACIQRLDNEQDAYKEEMERLHGVINTLRNNNAELAEQVRDSQTFQHRANEAEGLLEATKSSLRDLTATRDQLQSDNALYIGRDRNLTETVSKLESELAILSRALETAKEGRVAAENRAQEAVRALRSVETHLKERNARDQEAEGIVSDTTKLMETCQLEKRAAEERLRLMETRA